MAAIKTKDKAVQTNISKTSSKI